MAKASWAVLAVVLVGGAVPGRAAEIASVRTPEDPRPGTYVVEVHAVMNAPAVAVRHVVTRLCQYQERLEYLAECRAFRREGATQWSYAVANPPVVEPRDWVIATTVEENLRPDGTGRFLSRWHADDVQGPRPRPGITRVSLNEGTWQLTPLDGGQRTDVRYRLRTAPGGRLPAWLMGWVVSRTVPGNMRTLERLAQEEERRGRVVAPAADPYAGAALNSLDRLAQPSTPARWLLPASLRLN